MFVKTEERPQGEPHKVGTLKLSDAIRAGCRLSKPTHDVGALSWVTWQFDRLHSCVIGAAWLGLEGTDRQKYYKAPFPFMASMAEQTGVPHAVLAEAQNKYEVDRLPREQIADWLEAQGY